MDVAVLRIAEARREECMMGSGECRATIFVTNEAKELCFASAQERMSIGVVNFT